MNNHSSYQNITQSPMADAASGEVIRFDGNGAHGRDGGRGTLGFYGADLGSSRPTEGRVPAFLGLAEKTGGVYQENPPTVAEGLRATGLDFDVRHNPLTASRMESVLIVDDEGQPTMEDRPTGDHLDVPGFAATVAYPRDGSAPFTLGVTSKGYTIVQNDEALAVGDAISEGKLVALGAYGRPVGAKVYAAYELGDGFSVGGGDPYRSFVTITTTHDRSGGLVALMAPIRLGCTNQTTATFGRRATPRFTIRHTGVAKLKVDEARRILGIAHQYIDAYKEGAEELLSIPMSTDRFLVFAKEVWGQPEDEKLSKRSRTLVEARTEQLAAIITSETCEFGKGTAYAGYQAVVEYLDFYGTVRGGDSPETRRYERILSGELDEAKQRAWSMALATA